VRLSRTMNAVFIQSGRAKNLLRSYLVQYLHRAQNESPPRFFSGGEQATHKMKDEGVEDPVGWTLEQLELAHCPS
jgi:hypothetical protein